jgi:hypothetical protein
VAIEIKELVVRFSVEGQNEIIRTDNPKMVDPKALQEIIRQCTEEVLERLEYKTER